MRSRALISAMLCACLLPAAVATADTPNVPYSVPVTLTPPDKASPPTVADAPYTPTVKSLINQLLPDNPPTLAEIQNAAQLLRPGSNSTCHNTGTVTAPAGTTPAIAPICWSDAQGINETGPQANHTSAPQEILGLASSFDRHYANLWGQVEGTEGRELMVTGLFGPQVDLDQIPNWERSHQSIGEDPFLGGEMSAAQINGVQGAGLMSQMKHPAVYNGQFRTALTDVQDQALHEMLLTSYESGIQKAGAASIMCSYQPFRIVNATLPANVAELAERTSPFGIAGQTWPLNEYHWSCEQPVLLNYLLRGQIGAQSLIIGTDYGASHSANAILQGLDQEQGGSTYFNNNNPSVASGSSDATSSTCADASGNKVDCSAPGAVHVAGIPGPGCPVTGCSVPNAVANGTIPLPVFEQAIARVLYQEERFGLLGCNNSQTTCANPGGVGSDRTGTAPIPDGSTSGDPQIGTKNGDAAIIEKGAEEGAVLLKNDAGTLPLKSNDISGGVSVTGGGGEYLVADPSGEAAQGFLDRNHINPLQQLQALSGNASAFTYSPAEGSTGAVVPCSVLSSSSTPSGAPPASCDATSGLQRSSGATLATAAPDQVDRTIDNTALTNGQLPGNRAYRWTGSIYVPAADTYTFRLQYSATVPSAKVTFALDGQTKTLSSALSFYAGQYFRVNGDRFTVPVSPTNAGYIEPGLTNVQCAVPTSNNPNPSTTPPTAAQCPNAQNTPLSVGWHTVTITLDNTGITGNPAASLRFAYSRVTGDIADAAQAAAGKKLAIVFANDSRICDGGKAANAGGANSCPNGGIIDMDAPTPPTTGMAPLLDPEVQLIQAVAAVNPNTIVVLNTADPVIVQPWIDNPNVKAVLEMWNAGSEGSTATARLLLGHANPSGHTAITWPRNSTDLFWTYNETKPLYPGATTGTHPERLNGLANFATDETEGIYSGYRYYDQQDIDPQFAFGFGLSYTTFEFSGLKLTARFDGTVDVDFDIRNTGSVAGADVPQVYVGAGPVVPGIQQAIRSLRGFDRVSLQPGQTVHETIALDQRSFQYWDGATQRWTTNYGPRRIWVGDANALENLPLSATTAPLTSVSTTGGVGGTAPATLSLTLGTPATFGAFTPGLAKDYTTSMTANVISTAGDGALRVADPSSTATGHLVNGAFSLPSPLQAKASSAAGTGGALANVGGSAAPTLLLTYTGPTSNDAVTFGFGQHIGATDALRTGSYSKTLTFTLSTTQP